MMLSILFITENLMVNFMCLHLSTSLWERDLKRLFLDLNLIVLSQISQ